MINLEDIYQCVFTPRTIEQQKPLKTECAVFPKKERKKKGLSPKHHGFQGLSASSQTNQPCESKDVKAEVKAIGSGRVTGVGWVQTMHLPEGGEALPHFGTCIINEDTTVPHQPKTNVLPN